MPNATRLGKINEELLRELSRLISALKDPRVQGFVSLTRVDASRDLGLARVYVSVLDTEKSPEVMAGLRSASGFLRRELAAALSLRHTPQLQFIADDSLSRGAHIFELLSRLEHPNPEPKETDNDDA